jgi:hypothetical protein
VFCMPGEYPNNFKQSLKSWFLNQLFGFGGTAGEALPGPAGRVFPSYPTPAPGPKQAIRRPAGLLAQADTAGRRLPRDMEKAKGTRGNLLAVGSSDPQKDGAPPAVDPDADDFSELCYLLAHD